MKKHTKNGRFPEHRFQGGNLELSWPRAAAELAVPLGVTFGRAPVRFRGWKVRQGGAQARSERGRGFLAVDFRRPLFHWRGKMGQDAVTDLSYIEEMDVRGWELLWPGMEAPLPIDASTDWTHRVGISDQTEAGYPEPRYWLLRKTGHRPSEGLGFLLSGAGPGYYSDMELRLRGGLLTLTFCAVDLSPAQENLPDLYLIPGVGDLKQAEAEHGRVVGKEGFVRSSDRGRLWWRRPTLYVTNETLRTAAAKPAEFGTQVRRALDSLAARVPTEEGQRPGGAILALDTAWADAEGDWNPECALFADFEAYKAFRDELRAAGHSLVLALSPFKVGAGSLLAQEAPWFLLKDVDGLPAADRDGDYLLDYTLVDTRAMMEDMVRFYLGDGPEELGADGVCLAPATAVSNARAKWNDYSWSNGEMLWARALRLLADKAREVRPSALVEVEAATALANLAGDRIAPLGLLGRRGTPRAVRELREYGHPIPNVEGVSLARGEADWKRAARGDGYWGVVFSPAAKV